MKRIVMAWVLLLIFAFGVTPAMADISVTEMNAALTTEEDAEEADAVTETDAAEALTETDAAEDSLEYSETAAENDALLAAEAAGDSQQDDTDSETVNTAPVAENQELQTYRGVSVGGQLCAYDSEGDDLTFAITTEPMKGTVQLAPDGCFVYTPEEGKRGKDYFGFRATDSAGNVSEEGTVIIRLIKQKSQVTYSDMEGNGAEYAAVLLTEKGVFTGETVGSDYVFKPEDTVTRGEFLSMCMTAADRELLQGVSSTGFNDDDDIDGWLKPYVATALLRGYIQGEAATSGADFLPSEEITLRDACVMLNSVLEVTDVVSAAAYIGEENENASWAQAVANLTASGVMLAQWDSDTLDATLTRADAAELLANAMDLLSAR